jgi:hypothetical protein
VGAPFTVTSPDDLGGHLRANVDDPQMGQASAALDDLGIILAPAFGLVVFREGIEGEKGDPLSVRRPGKAPGAVLPARQLIRLPPAHRQDPDLALRVFSGSARSEEGDRATIRRPGWRRLAALAKGELPGLAPCDGNEPEMRKHVVAIALCGVGLGGVRFLRALRCSHALTEKTMANAWAQATASLVLISMTSANDIRRLRAPATGVQRGRKSRTTRNPDHEVAFFR